MITSNKERIAEQVLRVRLSQLIVNEDYKAGKFKIPIHLALGHEAIAVAVSSIMRNDDKLLLSHRNIAYNLARLGALRPILDEYFLKPTGLAGGRFGSMNLINPEKGVVYTSSILGNQFPVAVGVAMSEKVFGREGFVIVLAGDGSIEEGSLYESAVMAKSLELPMLFLVENNEWSMATKIPERRHPVGLPEFAKSVGLRYHHFEGNDPYDYAESLVELRDQCVQSGVPACLEVKVTTLGDWRGPKNAEYPDGKFINYHAGPAPNIALSDWPLITPSNEDPVFVLRKHVPEDFLRATAARLLESLKKELA